MSMQGMQTIGPMLRGEFEQQRALRQPYEQYWLTGLRQYRGIYDDKLLRFLSEADRFRSKVFIRYTRTKVHTLNARVMDLLFPAGEQKSWSIEPTPKPDIAPAEKIKIAQEIFQATGEVPDEEAVEEVIKQLAKDRCARMETVMHDQLVEGKFKRTIKRIVDDGHKFGTGVMKGPMTDVKEVRSWSMAGGSPEMVTDEEEIPYFEHVPIWDVYPDMGASEWNKQQFFWQRHVMSRHELRGLAKNPVFSSRMILRYIEDNENGDVKEQSYESLLRSMMEDERSGKGTQVKGMYELLERHGTLDGIQLREWGFADVDPHQEFPAVIWMLGQSVIGFELKERELPAIPYMAYHYEKESQGVFGVSLPEVVQDEQSIINGGMRAMMDHAGQAVGNLYEVNKDLLAPGEDPRAIHPMRVFVRTGRGADAAIPAIRSYSLDARLREFAGIVDLGKQLGDESSNIPSYLHGENGKGVGKTASGLSMLMGAASITVKDQVSNADDDVIKPFINAMYTWNMLHHPDQTIKGDYKTKATASSTLVAREQRAQSLDQFSAIAGSNPMIAPWVKWGKVAQEMANARDMDVIKTEAEYQQDMQAQQAMAGGVE